MPAARLASASAQADRLVKRQTNLAAGLRVVDRRPDFDRIVHPLGHPLQPVHRWFYYKEAFSPKLIGVLLEELGPVTPRRVLDPFAGVATTQLGASSRFVDDALGIEYAP